MSTTQSKPDHPPHRAAALWGLLIMPLSSLFFVNYRVRLFGFLDLPNPIGPAPLTAEIALWMHVTCAMLLLLPLETIGLVLGHHFGMRDRLIHRMLPPRTRQPP